ncbi:MAG: hypothetical protein ACJAZO_000049 [Myxococcota bacterium]
MGLTRYERFWSSDGFTFALCSTIVLLAVVMSPSTGFLHLGPLEIPELCTWRRWFGVECPGCGLTRSFVFMGHGSIAAAWDMNKIGPPLFLLVASQIPYRFWKMFIRKRDQSGHIETSAPA